jgi:hypothetical protein
MKRPFLLLICSLAVIFASAQITRRYKIAVFTPLYLDSVYNAAGAFKYQNTDFPKFTMPGLEFYSGVKAAADSLEKRDAPLEFFIYDTKGRQSLNQLLASPEFRDMDLIIGQTNATETRTLADAALRNKIPFISATFPNDAGISANPYFVVLNSTLSAHVESIYEFLQKYHTADKIIYFRKAGTAETQLHKDFTEMTRTTGSSPLNIRYVDLNGPFTSSTLANYLDSTEKNVCIVGSLDENFGARFITELSKLADKYPIRAIGMPTWERLNFPRSSNLEVVYTAPFYYNLGTTLESKLADEYSSTFSTKPTDLFFRGYETALRFSLLLLDTRDDISSNLSRKGNTVFTQFDIQPVFRDKSAMTLDYFENRHLYFIKVFGGVKNIVN